MRQKLSIKARSIVIPIRLKFRALGVAMIFAFLGNLYYSGFKAGQAHAPAINLYTVAAMAEWEAEANIVNHPKSVFDALEIKGRR